jgi:hypothetical protein
MCIAAGRSRYSGHKEQEATYIRHFFRVAILVAIPNSDPPGVIRELAHPSALCADKMNRTMRKVGSRRGA